jgi:hypothetical protein
LDESFADISDNTIEKNTAEIRGGGIYSRLSTPAVETNTAEEEEKDGETKASSEEEEAEGSARRILPVRRILTTESTTISNTKVSENYSPLAGGMNFEGKSVTITDSDISGNTADIRTDESADIVEGCNYGEAANSVGLCETCPSGKYSVKINADSCLPCPQASNCPGGSVIELNPGYWRPSIWSDKVEECLNREENCLGGMKGGNDLCFEGNIGALCESCDVG